MSKIDYSIFRYINIFTDLEIDLHIGDEKNVKNVISSQLESYGIETLEQLFESYDNGLFDDLRKSGHRTIKGIVELLKFRYLNEPLVADQVLSEKVVATERLVMTNKIERALLRLGFTQDEIAELINKVGKCEDMDYEGLLQTYLELVPVPQVKKKKDDIVISNLYHKIKLILEYKQQEDSLFSNQEPTKKISEQLRHQVMVLKQRRDGIDSTITMLLKELEKLEQGKHK